MKKRKLKISVTSSMLGQSRGQMRLSFGMIFSIILMVAFIVVAFYAIQKFLEIQNSVQVAKFARDLQEDVDRMWKGSEGSQVHEYFLPGKIDYVCFANFNSQSRGMYDDFYDEIDNFYYENENLFFYPPKSIGGRNSEWIKNIDAEKITSSENPFCIENIKGKIELTTKKEFGEALVTITK